MSNNSMYEDDLDAQYEDSLRERAYEILEDPIQRLAFFNRILKGALSTISVDKVDEKAISLILNEMSQHTSNEQALKALIKSDSLPKKRGRKTDKWQQVLSSYFTRIVCIRRIQKPEKSEKLIIHETLEEFENKGYKTNPPSDLEDLYNKHKKEDLKKVKEIYQGKSSKEIDQCIESVYLGLECSLPGTRSARQKKEEEKELLASLKEKTRKQWEKCTNRL